MKKVEQINRNGVVVIEEDNILGKKEIQALLSMYFPVEKENNYFIFYKNNKKYYLLVKNITYLGHPHPIHKKRIQVPTGWAPLLKRENSFLLGIYRHKNSAVFALFDKKQRGKSSSAHISTIDILKAVESGIFHKTDKQNNDLVVFRADKLIEVFVALLKREKIGNTKEIEIFDIFSGKIEKKWDGVRSYKEMIKANFSQALQPEWPGFYLEYKFEKFLNDNTAYKKTCIYIRDKKIGGLDFDIKFTDGKFFGDLKTHSEKSSSVLGNDKESVERVIREHNKLWYIVLELIPRKDSDFGCTVSKFWNRKLNELRGADKKDDSYCGRMKHDVVLINFYILEINKFNKRYISDFEQPRNSDGKPREVKIKIDRKDIDNFVIYRKALHKFVA